VRYLVTGSAGFIGFHLASYLSSQGHQVLGLDNYADYYSLELKKLRAENLKNSHNVITYELDLTNKSKLMEFTEQNAFDSIFHLAAQPGVRLKSHEYSKYHNSNIIAFTNILEATSKCDVRNFLYASSSSVYGNSTKERYSESEFGLEPISYYGATKLANELLASSFAKTSNTRVRGLRFFTVYGPWGRPDMAYLRLVNACLSGKQFDLFGSQETLRDFTFVDDVVRMVSRLNMELSKHSSGFADVVNIGGGQPESLSSMMKIIETETNSEIKVNYLKKNDNDVNRTYADSSYLESLIGMKPLISIQKGLPEVVNWAKTKIVLENLDKWIESVD
jgi:UDP-glucuronate 4-epimerase